MHYEKFAKTAVGNMFRHYDRSVKNKPDNIDSSKTHLNYNLCPHEQSQLEFYRQRLSEVKCQNRADVKTLCSWIVTLPEGMEKDERRFFETAYRTFSKKYGEENVISAWIHKDEQGRPHMHYAFIPIVEDKRRGGYKVSAKECTTRNDLQCMHSKMSKAMYSEFGYDVGIENGATSRGNKSVLELKVQSLQKQSDELADDLMSAKRDLNKLKGDILTEEQIKAQSVSKSLFSKDTVKVKYEDYQALKRTAERVKSVDVRERDIEFRERELKDRYRAFDERIEQAVQHVVDDRLTERIDDWISRMTYQEKYEQVMRFVEECNLSANLDKYLSKSRERMQSKMKSDVLHELDDLER